MGRIVEFSSVNVAVSGRFPERPWSELPSLNASPNRSQSREHAFVRTNTITSLAWFRATLYAARRSSPSQSTTKPQRGLDRPNQSSGPLFFFNKPI
jgi:hypothetical protein